MRGSNLATATLIRGDSFARRTARYARENVTEGELVIFDILTHPAPELSGAEHAEAKKVARELLRRLKQLLVLNLRKMSTGTFPAQAIVEFAARQE